MAFLGLGISHTGIIGDFAAAGAQVYVCDRAPQLSEDNQSLVAELGAKCRLGDSYLEGLSEFDLIFRTPAISSFAPQLVEAEEKGCKITGEIELFFELCPCYSIGITGSDGKTTTSTLISEMIKASGRVCHLGGNIGLPLLPRLKDMNSDDIVVAELSSFQLMSFKKSPDLAVITNIHQNHLDYHKDMGEYIASKREILLHGCKTAVLNSEDGTVLSMAKGLDMDRRLFGLTEVEGVGAFVKDGSIWLKTENGTEKIIDTDSLIIPGRHNEANAATACAAVMSLCTVEQMRQVLCSFGGVKHRIQLVGEIKGVRYYNDSIATTPSRTLVCLKAFPKGSVLIAGGSDKGVDYGEMAPEVIERVRLLILTGATSHKIEQAVRGHDKYKGSPQIVFVNSLKEAVDYAHAHTKRGGNVLLSPASASFDCFKSYGQRGDIFAGLVKELADA